MFIGVIPAALAIMICCPSLKLCPADIVTTGGLAAVTPVIVAAPKDVILSTIAVAPEVPPVNVSPVVNAPEAAPLTFR